jgi:putative tryptophan/tyrosine transport system substrate-binding protein
LLRRQILNLQEDCRVRRQEFIAGLGGAAAAWPIAGLGAAGWPLVVKAQQQTKPIIGWLDVRPGGPPREETEMFRRGLAEVGFSEGRDVTVEYHTADGHYERLPALAVDLVRRSPAAIVAITVPSALAAKAATRDIPVIFAAGDDAVELGLVANPNRPGGNLTGINLLGIEVAEKRLELLHKAVPAAETIAFLAGSIGPVARAEVRNMQSAAGTLGLRLLVFSVTTDAAVTAAFAELVEQQAGAILVSGTVTVDAKRDQFVSLAARFALPTMFFSSVGARVGGLLSYGPDTSELYRQVGSYTGRILKGEKPADLPVIQPTKYEFVNPHQSEDRQGAQPYHSAEPARPRRRDDRMNRREFIAGLGGAGV